MGLLIAAFCALVVVFAIQTYLLVHTLFPSDNVFMQWVTVFSFDGCCIIYAGLELFYAFAWTKAKYLVGIMWGVTFFGSLLCTIAYMNLSSDHLLHQIADSNVLILAYAVVTGVFSGDIVAMTYLIKGEYLARQTLKYGNPSPVTPPPPRGGIPVQSPASLAQTAASTRVLRDETTGEMFAVRPDGAISPLASAPSSNGAKPTKSEQEWKA